MRGQQKAILQSPARQVIKLPRYLVFCSCGDVLLTIVLTAISVLDFQ